MSAEQAELVEKVAVEMMRQDWRDGATQMMSLGLAYKFADPQQPPLPDNVFELRGHSLRAS